MKNYEYKFVEVPVAPDKKEDAKGFSPYKICARGDWNRVAGRLAVKADHGAEDERHRRERLSGYLRKRKRVTYFLFSKKRK